MSKPSTTTACFSLPALFGLLLVWLLAFPIACNEEDPPEFTGDPTPCPAACLALCATQKRCEDASFVFDWTAEDCKENCARIQLEDWGDSVSMAPLGCAAATDCDAFDLCLLLGGEYEYQCNGIEPAPKTQEYSADCTGICAYYSDCVEAEELPEYYYYDQQYCLEECNNGLQQGWMSERVLLCVEALNCSRMASCFNELQYSEDPGEWDDAEEPNLIPPDVAEPEVLP